MNTTNLDFADIFMKDLSVPEESEMALWVYAREACPFRFKPHAVPHTWNFSHSDVEDDFGLMQKLVRLDQKNVKGPVRI